MLTIVIEVRRILEFFNGSSARLFYLRTAA